VRIASAAIEAPFAERRQWRHRLMTERLQLVMAHRARVSANVMAALM
jgi:hypothetical protein